MSQLAGALLVLAAQLLPGLAVATLVERRARLGPAGFVALIPLSGLTVLGTVTLISGHLGYLGPALLVVPAVLGALGVIWQRRALSPYLARSVAAVARQWRAAPISVSSVVLGLLVAIVACFAPPWRIDEVEYHWAAPLEWAAAGRWIDSSFRHVDGFPFMEICYTAAATIGSYTGAHLLHLSTLVAIGFAAATAARGLGVRATGAVGAAAVAMPVMWDQAYVAYNDTGAGAFVTMAAAVALTGYRSPARLLLILVLIVVGVSIKPVALGAVGLVALIVLLTEWQERTADTRAWLWRTLKLWVVLTVTAAVVVAVWSTRMFLITGNWVDPDLAGPPSEDVLSRMPTTGDRLIAPLLPPVLGVLGAQEPWGGRLGVVMVIFLLPALGYAAWRRGDVGARFTRAVLPAWAHWVAVGLAMLRTRFHIGAWALMVVGLRVALEDAMDRYPRLRMWLGLAWGAAVLLSVVDVGFEMLRAIRDGLLT